MKVELINEDLIEVFINSFYFKDIDMNKKSELISIIKDIIVKIDTRYKLRLRGFYKIKVYPQKEIGVFLEIIKIDDNEFSDRADFRIVVYEDELFYLETDDYEIVNSQVKKFFYNQKFYININDIEDLPKVLDMGDIIYGDKVKQIKSFGKIIK